MDGKKVNYQTKYLFSLATTILNDALGWQRQRSNLFPHSATPAFPSPTLEAVADAIAKNRPPQPTPPHQSGKVGPKFALEV
jgi:hypothetical protein